jgi:hypothetical protein
MNAEFSADGHILACSSYCTTEFWDFQLSMIAASVDSNCKGAFSPVANLFAFVPARGRVCLLECGANALHNSMVDNSNDDFLGCVFFA